MVSQEAASVKQMMLEGKIVPYEVTLGLLQNVMESSGKQRFLIDGFPRALDQAFAFEKKVSSKIVALLHD